jgi:hypothetical protein
MIGLGFQSVKFVQGLGDLTNLRILGVSWRHSTDAPDAEGHREACISSLSKLFMSVRELRVGDIPDATLPFMASCFCNPPPLRRLILSESSRLQVVPHEISSLVNLTRLYIGVGGEVSKEGIKILANLPILVSLTVRLSDDQEGDSGIFHPRHAIKSQGFQSLVKFTFRCWCEAALEFEPGAMPKLQRLKLQLLARCRCKYGHGGLVLGLRNLACLKYVALSINCEAATANQVQAFDDDIRGTAGAHPNRPILQVERILQH